MVKVGGDAEGSRGLHPRQGGWSTATTWDMNDRHGVSFKADAIEAANKTAA